MAVLRLLIVRPVSLVFLVRRYWQGVPSFVLPFWGASFPPGTGEKPGLFISRLPFDGLCFPETLSPHTFPHDLPHICPDLRLRQRLSRSHIVGQLLLPLPRKRKPLAMSVISELNNAAFVLAVFGPPVRRFTSPVATAHARLASRDLLHLPGCGALGTFVPSWSH